MIGFNAFVEAYAKSVRKLYCYQLPISKFRYNGPRAEMIQFASKIADLELRYDLCMKYEIFDVAIGVR